jgi:glucuronate isomerase
MTDADRLLPADPGVRSLARELHALVADLPILSPHGHVDARLLDADAAFADAPSLLIQGDHYVTRLLHADGLTLDRLRLDGTEATARAVWRLLCERWGLFDGTASGYWLTRELIDVLGVTTAPSAADADALFDEIGARLADPAFRPRALLERFGLEVLATTDDPLDPLEAHGRLAADPAVSTRVAPTFRPDRLLDATAPGWTAAVDELGGAGYRGFRDALAAQRARFRAAGAFSADHGVLEPLTLALDEADAAAVFDRLRSGRGEAGDARAFSAHMLLEMARMSVDDGLVMTIHPGVRRNHHRPTWDAFGPDTGHDIPLPTSFTDGLRPLLEQLGTDPRLHLVLYTVDETVWSRELAPLAGFYPSVFLGSPWWFLDAPDAITRFRAAVTETAGFSRSSGFVDDTRAFCSIPVRHDASRRVEAAFLARLVAEGRVSAERAAEIIVDLVDGAPRRVFRL